MRFNTLRTVRLTTATLLGLLPLSVSVATAEVKNLKARAVSSDCIRLQWTGAARVAILRKAEDGPLKQIALVGAGQNQYVDDALEEDAVYSYRVEDVRAGLRYDFAGRASADGFVRVALADRYDQTKGYGIAPAENVESSGSRDRGGRTDPKLATLIWRYPTLTFVQDLANGEYRVSLASGDASYDGSASVRINGKEVVALTKTAPGKFVTVDLHEVEITGGKLTVEIGGHGRLNWLVIDPAPTGNVRFAEATAESETSLATAGRGAFRIGVHAVRQILPLGMLFP